MADDLIGKKIGGYQIIEMIGQGGMASVYRAHQVSMNRIVAVKVLSRQFLKDETYMQRFNREVEIVSRLEHRSIVPVHDYGETDGQPYIVMRYMPGGSVDDLLHEGALDLERMISIIEQVAPALDYAHSKGVLHRDLKPSNILMDDDGGAYLTDFGIARIDDTKAATLTTQGVVGTPSYMSPEQAQGQPLDGRSDIYSLGVTLFEMATGQRPFEADTPYSIAVLQVTAKPPYPRSLNSSIPSSVENVILTAMSKKREERYGTAVRMAEALKVAAEPPPTSLFDTQPRAPRPEPVPPPVNNANTYTAPATPPPPAAASSPYGVPRVSRRSRLVRQRSGSLWISAAVGGLIGCGLLTLLVLIAIVLISSALRGGGQPTVTVPAGASTAAATGTHATSMPTQTAGASTVTQVAPVGQRETLAPLPAGEIVYFAERSHDYNIFKMNLATRQETQLTNTASSELYPAVSPDGTQIAFMSDQDGDYDIYVMDIDGRSTHRVTNNSVTDRIPSWSPDGSWIAFSSDTRGDGSYDLYEVHPDGSGLKLLLSNGDRNHSPHWSPDSRYLVFSGGPTDDGATWEIRRLDLQTGDVVSLTNNSVKDWSPNFAPDGGLIYLTEGDGHAAIARMNIDGGNPRILYDGPGYEWGESYSHDGKLITFNSDVTGSDEIYLMNADGSDVRQVTDQGGMAAAWLPS